MWQNVAEVGKKRSGFLGFKSCCIVLQAWLRLITCFLTFGCLKSVPAVFLFSWCFCGFLIIEDFLTSFFLALWHFVGVIYTVFLAGFSVRQLWRASLVWQLSTDFVAYKWLLVCLVLTSLLLWTFPWHTVLVSVFLVEALGLLLQKPREPDDPTCRGVAPRCAQEPKNSAVGTSGCLSGMPHPAGSRQSLTQRQP